MRPSSSTRSASFSEMYPRRLPRSFISSGFAHCHLGLGKLYHRTDKREQAREHLATATTMYRETGMTY